MAKQTYTIAVYEEQQDQDGTKRQVAIEGHPFRIKAFRPEEALAEAVEQVKRKGTGHTFRLFLLGPDTAQQKGMRLKVQT